MGQLFQLTHEWREPASGDRGQGAQQDMDIPVRGTERAFRGIKRGKAVCSDAIPSYSGMNMLGTVCSGDTMQIGHHNHYYKVHATNLAKQHSGPYLQRKGDIQECKNYSSIKLLAHTHTHTPSQYWEKSVDRGRREGKEIHESQFGFMPWRSTTYAILII